MLGRMESRGKGPLSRFAKVKSDTQMTEFTMDFLRIQVATCICKEDNAQVLSRPLSKSSSFVK
ncbi:hypothetical protein STEG23_007983, partial [Scotinomys teguina]